MKPRRSKPWSQDILDQALDEFMPVFVGFFIELAPEDWLSDKEALWIKALPFISIAIGRYFPDDKPWSGRADDIRTRFFAELKRQLGSPDERKEKGSKTMKSLPDEDAILKLTPSEFQNLFSWIETRVGEKNKVRIFLKRLTLRELKTFVALQDEEKTQYYEFRKEKSRFALSDEVKGDLPKLAKDTADAIDRGTERIKEGRKKIEDLRKKIQDEIARRRGSK